MALLSCLLLEACHPCACRWRLRFSVRGICRNAAPEGAPRAATWRHAFYPGYKQKRRGIDPVSSSGAFSRLIRRRRGFALRLTEPSGVPMTPPVVNKPQERHSFPTRDHRRPALVRPVEMSQPQSHSHRRAARRQVDRRPPLLCASSLTLSPFLNPPPGRVWEFLGALGVSAVQYPGVEGDDIIASIALAAAEQPGVEARSAKGSNQPPRGGASAGIRHQCVA